MKKMGEFVELQNHMWSYLRLKTIIKIYIAVFREANRVADSLAKRGLHVAPEVHVFHRPPAWIRLTSLADMSAFFFSFFVAFRLVV